MISELYCDAQDTEGQAQECEEALENYLKTGELPEEFEEEYEYELNN
jgi:hypothetical protein